MRHSNNDSRKALATILGLKNLKELLHLSSEDRPNIFREVLVADCPVGLVNSVDDPLEAKPQVDALRLFARLLDGCEGERQIAEEARRIFYRENHFVMWAGELEEFLQGCFEDSASEVPVSTLVRILDIGLLCTGDFYQEAEGLQRILELSNLELCSIELSGTVARNGSDLLTQRAMRSISAIVTQLILRLDDGLTISKAFVSWKDWPRLPFGQPGEDSYNLRPFWETPSKAVVKRVESGGGTFEEIMQVQIAFWTDEPSLSMCFREDYFMHGW